MQLSYIKKIKKLFTENKDKRICVIGTTCTGKTTIINKLKIGLDMDEEIFSLLTKEETDYVCQTPWTREIGEKMDYFVKTKLKIDPGFPLFGTVLIDCDLIIYLHINDELLKKRTDLRKVNFINAKNMQIKIEEELNNTDIKTIKIEITE